MGLGTPATEEVAEPPPAALQAARAGAAGNKGGRLQAGDSATPQLKAGSACCAARYSQLVLCWWS